MIQRRKLTAQLKLAVDEIEKLRQEKEYLLAQLYADDLTGLANRRAFDEKLPELVRAAQSSQQPLALLIADVSGLKRTNDNLGHARGDEVLRAVGQAFLGVARTTDLVGRLGGDEFYAILPGFEPLDDQTQGEVFTSTFARYHEAFASKIRRLNLPTELAVDVSFGIAMLEPHESADELYKRADQACQASKQRKYKSLDAQGINFEDPRL